MNKKNLPIDLYGENMNGNAVCSLNDDLILLDKPTIYPDFKYPFKTDVTTVVICLKGSASGTMNLRETVTRAPSLTIIQKGQVMQYEYISKDFEGLFIVMSRRFTDGLQLNIEDVIPTMLSIHSQPSICLNERELDAIVNYYEMLRGLILAEDNPYRMEAACNLTRAFFYGASYYFHKAAACNTRPIRSGVLDKLLPLIQQNFKQYRYVEFYAEKMSLTSKYLSKVVKETSGKTVMDWIEQYTILEAKALFRSTNMTIQQVSEELNFPSQSFFGKYFKRLTGYSPKEYKNGNMC